MSNKEIFIQYVGQFMRNEDTPEEAIKYFDSLRARQEKEKSPVSHLGYLILKAMKADPETEFTAKMLGEEISHLDNRYISGRTASGATRALIAKGLIEKVSDSRPIAYIITQAGMESNYNDPEAAVEE